MSSLTMARSIESITSSICGNGMSTPSMTSTLSYPVTLSRGSFQYREPRRDRSSRSARERFPPDSSHTPFHPALPEAALTSGLSRQAARSLAPPETKKRSWKLCFQLLAKHNGAFARLNYRSRRSGA